MYKNKDRHMLDWHNSQKWTSIVYIKRVLSYLFVIQTRNLEDEIWFEFVKFTYILTETAHMWVILLNLSRLWVAVARYNFKWVHFSIW